MAKRLCWAPHPLTDGTTVHCQRWHNHDGIGGTHRTMTFDHEWSGDSTEPCPPSGCGKRPLGKKPTADAARAPGQGGTP